MKFSHRVSKVDLSPFHKALFESLLGDILACLRAQALSYQTSHWQVKGDDYYGNHLLFMRLYESVGDQVDALAEKMVGYLGSGAVDISPQMDKIREYTASWDLIECHHQRGLKSETDLQNLLKASYDEIKDMGAMTLGLDDWIMATASEHESNEYLLQQALGGIRTASGAPTAEGEFYDNPEKREVLEFAESGAISNDAEVAASAAAEQKADSVPVGKAISEELKAVEDSPPTPTEIVEQAGGSAVSTLNRFVVDTEDPAVEPAVDMNQSRMAAWLRQIV